MYSLYLQDCVENSIEKASFSMYTKIFKSMHLSFHRPKKDQCSLCNSYLQGSDEIKANLNDRYKKHIQEKEKVRYLKNNAKVEAKNHNTSVVCASFDLQQVIHVPISNDNKIFYKRRLAVFNFTIYDIGSRDCYCFTWNEGNGKRGSCEIATALCKFLFKYDEDGIKEGIPFLRWLWGSK